MTTTMETTLRIAPNPPSPPKAILFVTPILLFVASRPRLGCSNTRIGKGSCILTLVKNTSKQVQAHNTYLLEQKQMIQFLFGNVLVTLHSLPSNGGTSIVFAAVINLIQCQCQGKGFERGKTLVQVDAPSVLAGQHFARRTQIISARIKRGGVIVNIPGDGSMNGITKCPQIGR
jgi:hypothetical protein